MVTESTKTVLRGGEFIVKESKFSEIYIPEQITEEQRMFRDMALDFIKNRVWPNVDRIDKQDWDFNVSLLNEAGELGLLGAALPEEYNGMGISFIADTYLSEVLGQSHSFSVSLAAHTGIGTLPILYYGTAEQKAQYLPKLATGEWKAAYCLTEPGSGSDALSAKSKAVMNAEGTHYVLNGQKMWITNSGFANVFIVFAQIDGDKFTGFIVDAKSPGISLGNEEDKMGIKGSSTRQVFFNDVLVPKENVLGNIGEGHKIAFNVLNIGRFKLGAMTAGGAKKAISVTVNYANERIQFKVPISSFGAIKHKLAEQAIKTWVTESAVFRIAGYIQDKIDELVGQGVDAAQAKLRAAEEYSIECALIKVMGSETVDYVTDEAVQVFGGTGFSEEYPVARAYRDSRINRIFEGTNEINRLLAVAQLLKKALRGTIDLVTPGMAIQKELMSIPTFSNDDESFFAAEKLALRQAKKALLMVSGAAGMKYMRELENQQELLMNAADVMLEIFACESAVLRTEKLVDLRGEAACQSEIDMTRVYLSDALERMYCSGKHAVAAFAEGDELRMMMMGLKRFTKYDTYNTIAARRRIADKLIEANEYCF